jgi:hypothetical protein
LLRRGKELHDVRGGLAPPLRPIRGDVEPTRIRGDPWRPPQLESERAFGVEDIQRSQGQLLEPVALQRLLSAETIERAFRVLCNFGLGGKPLPPVVTAVAKREKVREAARVTEIDERVPRSDPYVL